MGATCPGRWHWTQERIMIGATSFVNVGAWGTPAADASGGAPRMNEAIAAIDQQVMRFVMK
jgi:hypothetical protein